MPTPRAAIESHPQRKELIQAIVRGDTYRSIAKRYGISQGTITRLIRAELAAKIAAAKASHDIMDGTFVIESAGQAAESLRKMLQACERYLQDPDDTDAFAVGPRATEVEVIIEEHGEDGRIKGTRKATLQELLDEVEGNIGAGAIQKAELKITDPRKLILDTADLINRQLATIAKISAAARGFRQDMDARQKVVESELWGEVTEALIRAFGECPHAQAQVRGELERIARAAGGN